MAVAPSRRVRKRPATAYGGALKKVPHVNGGNSTAIPIGLYDPAEADLKDVHPTWSARFSRERRVRPDVGGVRKGPYFIT